MWLKDIGDVLRAAGVPVIERRYKRGQYAGLSWDNVGRDRGTGREGFTDFRFVMWHHDASAAGSSTGVDDYCMYMPLAPACNAWVCLGCDGAHQSGTWHLIAGGRANHAGSGGPGWGVARDDMNHYAFGIEVDHTTKESWTGVGKPAQLDSLRRGTAAVMAAYDIDPVPGLLFHKTWTDGGIDGVPVLATRGRKTDIAGLDLVKERAAVQRFLPPLPVIDEKPVVRVADVQPGRRNASVFLVKKALASQGLGQGFVIGTYFGSGLERAWKKWERKLGYGMKAGSTPSRRSLEALGNLYGFEVE